MNYLGQMGFCLTSLQEELWKITPTITESQVLQVLEQEQDKLKTLIKQVKTKGVPK